MITRMPGSNQSSFILVVRVTYNHGAGISACIEGIGSDEQNERIKGDSIRAENGDGAWVRDF